MPRDAAHTEDSQLGQRGLGNTKGRCWDRIRKRTEAGKHVVTLLAKVGCRWRWRWRKQEDPRYTEHQDFDSPSQIQESVIDHSHSHTTHTTTKPNTVYHVGKKVIALSTISPQFPSFSSIQKEKPKTKD